MIAKVKRVDVIGLNKDRDGILALLQRLGRVQLINLQQQVTISPQTAPSDVNILEIEDAIIYLASFKEKQGFLSGFIKPYIHEKQLEDVINSFNWQQLLKELQDLRNQLKDLMHHTERLMQKRQFLVPWDNLSIPLEEIHPTKNCDILFGILPSRDYSRFLYDLEKEAINCYHEIINQDKTNTYLVILYLKKDFERLEAILKNYHFNFTILGHGKDTIINNLSQIDAEICVLGKQIQEVKTKILVLSKEEFKLMIIYDYLVNIKRRTEKDTLLGLQQYTFILSGWCRAKEVPLIEDGITKNFSDVEIFISEPREGENIPVILENTRLIQPFEFITQIYGMPKYNELDPTPFLAPFFFLYFGFCVSDVGYGLMLALLSWFALKKFRMGAQGKKFFELFLFCGISTIVIGALMGSWFGNLVDLLGDASKIFLPIKRFKDSLVLLDPLKEPTKLLGIALSFGIIQVWFGNIIAGIGNIKNKRYLDVLYDQVPMLTLLFGLTGLGLIFLELLDGKYINIFKYTTILGAVGLILTQGRSEKGIGGRLFYGIYNLYNALSGYLSDILSYSRLWALGLVTGVMAGTVNLIAIQFSKVFPKVIPFIDRIFILKIIFSIFIIATIFIFGHLVSFFMNLLGAFVHPVRLQFVEFFSKFFKSGGDNFRPFKVETKYVNMV